MGMGKKWAANVAAIICVSKDSNQTNINEHKCTIYISGLKKHTHTHMRSISIVYWPL